MDLPDEKVMCHHTAFEKSCFDMVTRCKCPKWVTLRGKHPQTGADVDQSSCVDSMLPLLLLENAKVSRQTGAAVESFRNEVVKAEQARQNPLVNLPNNMHSLAVPGVGFR